MNKLPDISKDFPGWYNEVIYQAELVDHSPVRGTMVVRPYGWAIWENIKEILDKRIKETGHENASFPLFIPESFIKREAKHVEGFAPELAIVTHAGGKKLEEPLVVRPTSETIVHYMFARWIKSWRDLPLKINQWANVVRWELRSRPFLRTTEFFWQEGHTAHETHEEADLQVRTMIRECVDLAHNYLAIPVIAGLKSESEKFPGAEYTMTSEGFMPDGKALQMGTAHLLSQSFAKSFEIQFQDRNKKLSYPYLTSWCGATTRLVGAVIMTHGDQKGLVIPPKIAPIQVVIIPILKKGTDSSVILTAVNNLAKNLKEHSIRVFVDVDETKTPGAKFFKWELKGVPLRIELGPRDLEQNQAMVVDRLGLNKQAIQLDRITQEIPQMIEIIQNELFERAQKRMKKQWEKAEKLTEFGPQLDKKPVFFQTGWCGNTACEVALKEYKATIRVLLDGHEFKSCFHCEQSSKHDVLVAKAY